MKWSKFIMRKYNPLEPIRAPFDGLPFLACIWDTWTGLAVYARHYDCENRCPGKYEFFYVSQDPEEKGWEIKIEEDPFPITRWMPLPLFVCDEINT